jgi:predicted naringenin-chalcone synthase
MLEWLVRAHAESEATSKALDDEARDAFAARIRRVMGRCACGPDKIHARGHAVPDVDVATWAGSSIYDIRSHPHGSDCDARSRFFDDTVSTYFDEEYERVDTPPSELIHVTCTGYASPSGAQKLVARRGWGALTRVTHAYHMGCYAAFPAVRLAVGSLCMPRALASTAVAPRVDIVHTELCSLHFDPSQHELEQLVVQSLFADGLIRYSVEPGERGAGLEVLALDEQLVPDSAQCMTWMVSTWGMKMTLARDVPDRIAGGVRAFVSALFRRAQLDPAPHLAKTVFAVHPGGPKIIDRVAQVLELDEAQVHTSRDVLADCGNMSSATLPHIWARLAADDAVAPGTLIASMAFGPGLTIAGGLFRKV